MKFSIAQIGENRLKRVLIEDRNNGPEKLCEVLKSDFMKVLSCYVEKPQVDIELLDSEEGVVFDVSVRCERVKSFGVLSY